jgi:hypothetical protein
MSQKSIMGLHLIFRGKRLACIVVLLCICVVMQMLGTPFMLLNQNTQDTSDVSTVSLSEGFTLLPTVHESERLGFLCFYQTFQPPVHSRIFSISIFHPPQYKENSLSVKMGTRISFHA